MGYTLKNHNYIILIWGGYTIKKDKATIKLSAILLSISLNHNIDIVVFFINRL